MIEIKQIKENDGAFASFYVRQRGGVWYILNERIDEQEIRSSIDRIGFDLFVLSFCDQVRD